MTFSDAKHASLILLRVVGQVKHRRNYVNRWLSQFDCGRTLEVDQGSLVKGTVPACRTCRHVPSAVANGLKIMIPMAISNSCRFAEQIALLNRYKFHLFPSNK